MLEAYASHTLFSLVYLTRTIIELKGDLVASLSFLLFDYGLSYLNFSCIFVVVYISCSFGSILGLFLAIILK